MWWLWKPTSRYYSRGHRKFSSRPNFTAIMNKLREIQSSKCFGGYQKVFAHDSEVNNCEMRFSIYLPPQVTSKKLPVIYILSGLTMDHITCMEKAGFHKFASEEGVIIVAPDSSPHNAGISGEKDKWNYGRKASYYIDANQEPWSKHYKMHSYVSKELPKLVKENFPVLPGKQSIIGHSIGGYGALYLTLKNPDMYVSTSALSPVCDVTLASHSLEGLELYLGKDKIKWEEWSTFRLARNYSGPPLKILIDQGTADEYLSEHLHPNEFIEACKNKPISITYNTHEGYDHYYFFVKSFIGDHIKYHMKFLKSD